MTRIGSSRIEDDGAPSEAGSPSPPAEARPEPAPFAGQTLELAGEPSLLPRCRGRPGTWSAAQVEHLLGAPSRGESVVGAGTHLLARSRRQAAARLAPPEPGATARAPSSPSPPIGTHWWRRPPSALGERCDDRSQRRAGARLSSAAGSSGVRRAMRHVDRRRRPAPCRRLRASDSDGPDGGPSAAQSAPGSATCRAAPISSGKEDAAPRGRRIHAPGPPRPGWIRSSRPVASRLATPLALPNALALWSGLERAGAGSSLRYADLLAREEEQAALARSPSGCLASAATHHAARLRTAGLGAATAGRSAGYGLAGRRPVTSASGPLGCTRPGLSPCRRRAGRRDQAATRRGRARGLPAIRFAADPARAPASARARSRCAGSGGASTTGRSSPSSATASDRWP